MPLMDTISTRHQELLDACSVGMLENHEEVVRFVREVALTGAHVSDVRQRAHLRSFIRFWSSFLYEQTGQFQDFALLPSVTIGPTSHQPQSTELSPEFNRDDPNDLATNPFDSPATAFNDGRDTMLRQFGPYKIIEAIGEGGFSKVYKVFDTERKEIVALKIYDTDQVEQRRSFIEGLVAREMQVAQLQHPHIIPFYGTAEYKGMPYITMKLIDSGLLTDRLKNWYWRPSLGSILRIISQAADGLGFLHEHSIVHRDIKPANLLLLTLDDHVYLTDFGVAQIIEGAF